jgi:regulator of sigma E protease
MNLLLGVLLYTVIFIRTGMPDTTRVKVLDVAENSPAAELGIQPGDLIVQVNGQGAKSQQDFLDAIYSNLGKVVTITYQRGDATYEGSLVPRPNPPQGQGAIGIVMGYAMLPVSVPQAVSSGVVAVYQDCRNILMLPVRILRREINPDAGRLVGYRGMFNLYQDARQGEIIPGLPADISILLFFTQITISLGLLNLLPFPALDGGRILFVLPELVLRRRVPQQFENVVNLVGITILILLMLYINLQEWI